jgi:hypothetical protein
MLFTIYRQNKLQKTDYGINLTLKQLPFFTVSSLAELAMTDSSKPVVILYALPLYTIAQP